MKAQSQNNQPQGEALLGDAVDTAPAKRPEPVVLSGHFGHIKKLDAKHHGDLLWQALAGHDGVWTYMKDGPFATKNALLAYLEMREQQGDPYFYAILDNNGDALGLASLMSIRPEPRVIEVGSISYAPALQRTALATEAQYLLMRYAFEELGYRRYEWKCNALNKKSRQAAERYGFTYEGTFRQNDIIKGRNRDTAWYSILDKEWPMRKHALERWLQPENFDVNGKQIKSLARER